MKLSVHEAEPQAEPGARVQALVAAGKISSAEGGALLGALSNASPISIRRSLLSECINPFTRLGGGRSALLGLAIALLSVLATRLAIRFDGALDLHAVTHGISAQSAALEQCVVWGTTASLFWVAASLLGAAPRFVDMLGAVGLAHLPTLLLAVPVGLLSPRNIAPDVSAILTPSLAAIAFFGILSVVWNITWLYQGFKNASGLRGVRLVGGLIAALVVSEVATKLILARVV
jgi:hypothetical protein